MIYRGRGRELIGGRGAIFNALVYSGIYAQAWWGAFLWRVYRAIL